MTKRGMILFVLVSVTCVTISFVVVASKPATHKLPTAAPQLAIEIYEILDIGVPTDVKSGYMMLLRDKADPKSDRGSTCSISVRLDCVPHIKAEMILGKSWSPVPHNDRDELAQYLSAPGHTNSMASSWWKFADAQRSDSFMYRSYGSGGNNARCVIRTVMNVDTIYFILDIDDKDLTSQFIAEYQKYPFDTGFLGQGEVYQTTWP